MSNLTLTPQYNATLQQNQGMVIGPGIAGLFIQGIETGLVISQFCRWFSSTERNDSVAFSTLVIFVTMVGLCVDFRTLIFCSD
jgi:hypothetical protein